MKIPLQLITLSLFFALSMPSGANSQTDAHYWTHQYGAKGLLMNGAVIAAPSDETSLFYNPGAIGKSDNLGFAFSFLTPTFSSLTSTNLLGDNKKFTDNSFGLAPGFLAVRFRPFPTRSITLGVTSFQRLNTNLRFTDRTTGFSADDPQDIFRGDFDFDRHISQSWHGIGIAWNITPALGIGITQYSVWHDETLDLDIKRELYAVTTPTALSVGIRSKTYYDFSIKSAFLTKLGVAFDGNHYRIGLTITTPIYGGVQRSAEYLFDYLSKEERREITVASNRPQIDLNKFKTPFSVGIGFEIDKNDWTIAFSAEFFANIDSYDLIRDLDDPLDGLLAPITELPFSVSYSNKSVLNFAIGAQKKINESESILMGFRSDFNQKSNFNINDNLQFTSTNPSVFHVSGGGLFEVRNNFISIGFDYGIGIRRNGEQIFDTDQVNRSNLLEFGSGNNAKNTYHTATLFLTYDFILSRMEAGN